MASPDKLGRKIAGLLTYNPGPGIYSRLERAIQAMPENVRTQELPGLLKRYKEGVPGWELKATDLDSVIAGRDVVPRSELLARVQERSPVYTHGEKLLGGDVPVRRIRNSVQSEDLPAYDRTPFDSIGSAESSGRPVYEPYGQGGKNYGELLITQPGVLGEQFGSHWNQVFGGQGAVAHARYDTHGDALRINELQSDLGIHNRKVREAIAREEGMGPEAAAMYRNKEGEELPFPLEDAWADLLIKRLALEAARKGHRAIEVASPRAIADKVGGNIDNYEHFYGKVVPGAIERLGRKMGGVVDDTPSNLSAADESQRAYAARLGAEEDSWRDLVDAAIDRAIPAGSAGRASHQLGPTMRDLERNFRTGVGSGDLADSKRDYAYRMFQNVARQHLPAGANADEAAAAALRDVMPFLSRSVEAGDDYVMAKQRIRGAPALPVARRYLMSDEMRRRLIEQGVGASLLAPLLMQEGE